MTGKFIVIEGLEGAGKSTASECVFQLLKARGVQVERCREPGGTELGEALRDLVKKPDFSEPPCALTELLIMYASRAQLVETKIKPALEQGIWVLGDRHDLSSQAYQGGGRGLSKELLENLSQTVLGNFKPDFTLYMDIDPVIGLARARGRGELDRIEQESLAFFERTRSRYLELVNADDRIAIIDASQPIEQVQASIEQALSSQFERWNNG